MGTLPKLASLKGQQRHGWIFRLLDKRVVAAYRGEELQGCRLGAQMGRVDTEVQGH